MIRPVNLNDIQSITDIYNHYIEHTAFTFDEKPLSLKEMERKVLAFSKDFPWLVYEHKNTVLGYAYACEWKSKSAYKPTVETTIYLTPGESGKGIGSKLYQTLIDQLEHMQVHALLAGIAHPSVAFHEKLGFEKVGQLKEVGFKFNQWIDVGYWELILNEN